MVFIHELVVLKYACKCVCTYIYTCIGTQIFTPRTYNVGYDQWEGLMIHLCMYVCMYMVFIHQLVVLMYACKCVYTYVLYI
jgi:hypothetical protein